MEVKEIRQEPLTPVIPEKQDLSVKSEEIEEKSVENKDKHLDYDSDEELHEKLKLLEGHQYDEWLRAAGAEEEDEDEEKDSLDGDISLGSVKDRGSSALTQKLQEPYGSCLLEEIEEERKIQQRKIFVEKQKSDKRRESSILHQILTHTVLDTDKTAEIEPWKYLPSSEIEHRQRILSRLDHELKFQTSQVNSLKEAFNKRWDKLGASQNMIADALEKLNELEEASREKRQIANKITDETNAEIAAESTRIKIQEKELEYLNGVLKQCNSRLEKHSIFQEFLQQVKDASNGQFKNIRQVCDRFHLLNTAKSKLMFWEDENERDIFIANLELHNTIKKRNKNNLLQDNYLSELRKYQESNSNKLAALEDQLVLVKSAAASQCMLLGQLDLSIQNLYLEICEQIHLKPKAQYTRSKVRTRSKILAQLGDIESCMKQLRDLSQNIRGNLNSATFNVAMEVDTRALYKERLKFKI